MAVAIVGLAADAVRQRALARSDLISMLPVLDGCKNVLEQVKELLK